MTGIMLAMTVGAETRASALSASDAGRTDNTAAIRKGRELLASLTQWQRPACMPVQFFPSRPLTHSFVRAQRCDGEVAPSTTTDQAEAEEQPPWSQRERFGRL